MKLTEAFQTPHAHCSIESFVLCRQVAEMTGRQDAMMRSVDGMSVQSRAEVAGVPMHKINLHEQENFQSGRKLIAVISEAASSGISLQVLCVPTATTRTGKSL